MKMTLFFVALALMCWSCEIKPTLLKTWKITKPEPVAIDTLTEILYLDAYLSFYDNGEISFYQEYFHDSKKTPLYQTRKWKEYGSGLELTINQMDFTEKFEITEHSTQLLIIKFIGDSSIFKGTKFTCQPSSTTKAKRLTYLNQTTIHGAKT